MKMIQPKNGTFQLTPSRRATMPGLQKETAGSISTHALTEGDSGGTDVFGLATKFQLTPSRRATEQREHCAVW